MTPCKRLLLLTGFAASTVFAAPNPTISSVTPSSGSNAGGTHVTIKGTGFSDSCSTCVPPFKPPFVLFDVVQSSEVKFIDSTTLDVVTPRHFPTTVTVTIYNEPGTGAGSLADAFTYTGDPTDGFDPILFPIFMPPVQGAFNSDFRTEARIWNKGPLFFYLFGEETNCLQLFVPQSPFRARSVGPSEPERSLPPDCSLSVGRVLWTSKGGPLATNLRVGDVSRSATSHGTEIPVVRMNDFTEGKIALLGVPRDPRFRITLRIYSLARPADPVPVTIEGLINPVFLVPGADVFQPSYVEVRDLPRTLTRVVIMPSGLPLWAFITVTNNDTQQITTITPN